MKILQRIIPCLLALVLIVLTGFDALAKDTKDTDRKILVKEKLPRPEHILVFDFVATPDDIPADSAFASLKTEQKKPQTTEQIEKGRKLGDQLAGHLVEEIRAMGMPAERATTGSVPKLNDLVIRGYIVSIEEGDAKKRVGIGFGAGNAVLKTAVEGFVMTGQGLRKVGFGKTDSSGGGKTPGTAATAVVAVATKNPLGLIVSTGVKAHGEKSGKSTIEGKTKQTAQEIAKELKMRFQDQGWIK